MKKISLLFVCLLSMIPSVFCQKDDLITVKAGTKILDYFPVSERYMYPDFITGHIVFKNNLYSDRPLNFNFLLEEMEFIQGRDTLSIINKKDIRYISIAQDTFCFEKSYIRQIRGGRMKLGLREFIELREIRNLDSYGTASSGAATTSYGSMPMDGNFYKLTANKDMIFQKTRLFYLNIKGAGFVLINRKNLYQLFPSGEKEIKSFLKTKKISFDKQEDILKLTDFLENLNIL